MNDLHVDGSKNFGSRAITRAIRVFLTQLDIKWAGTIDSVDSLYHRYVGSLFEYFIISITISAFQR